MKIISVYPCPFDPLIRHDIAAAIINNGEIYAYEEGKLTHIRGDGIARLPERSLMMGLKEMNLLPKDADLWVFPYPHKPVSMESQYLFFSHDVRAYRGSWQDFPAWHKARVRFVAHHDSHCALAVLASGFDDCAFLSIDAGGDAGDTRNLAFGEFANNEFHLLSSDIGNCGIANFHDFLTDAIGFANFDNGKTAGLAGYGTVKPELEECLKRLLKVTKNGMHFERARYEATEVNLAKIRPSEFDRNKFIYHYPSLTNVLKTAIGFLPQDIAATGEKIVQDQVMEYLRLIKPKTRSQNLVLSGGLFQNVALNNHIWESGSFEHIYIPMAPSDAGLCLGAALYVAHKAGLPRLPRPLSAYLGPSYGRAELLELLDRFRFHYTVEKNIAGKGAELIAKGKVVGWFQGRAEFGPRSLGNRSILADPRAIESKLRINQLLKKRDWFMPYAPSMQQEYLNEWLEKPCPSPYMQIAFRLKKEKYAMVPGAVHVDGTSRVHVVSREENPLYWNLIEEFRLMTGLPLVLNTSFNRHGIATISTPRQAIEHFVEGCMDYLIIDNFILSFEENRIAKEFQYSPKDEKLCLAEDVFRRWSVVATHGTAEQKDHYLEETSKLLGVEIKEITPKGFQIGETEVRSLQGEEASSALQRHFGV